MANLKTCQLQDDTEEFAKPPVDLVPTVPAAGWSLLWLATAQAAWRNMPNWSLQEVLQILPCHPVLPIILINASNGPC